MGPGQYGLRHGAAERRWRQRRGPVRLRLCGVGGVGRAVTTAGRSLAARAAVHIAVVVAVLAFLTRPGSPGARGIAAVSGSMAGLVAEAVT
jgi:hypothetical protein